MKIISFRKIFYLLIPAIIFIFASCAGREQLGLGASGVLPADQVNDPYILTIETSVALLSFARGLADQHGAEHTITAVGRSAAIESVTEGRADIAFFSGALPDEIENVNTVIIGAEVIHFVTGLTNSRSGITLDELYALFIDYNLFDDMGWDDDWPDDWDDDWDEDWDDDWDEWYYDDWEYDDRYHTDFEIPTEGIALTLPGVYSRVLLEDLFHLRDNIGGVMLSLIPEDANQFNNDNEVLDFVRQNPETIGVVKASSIPEGVKVLSLEGIYPMEYGYLGYREVILAYRADNPAAVAFAAALSAGQLDIIFQNNSVVRN